MRFFFKLLIIIIAILLEKPLPALADAMVEYKNEQDHYSISIPCRFNYQDVSIIKNTSFVALNMIGGASIYIEKLPEILFFPSEQNVVENDTIFWNQSLKSEYIGYRIRADYILKESGTNVIEDRGFYWEKYESDKQTAMVYQTFNHGILYKIYYIYKKEESATQEDIAESIHSFTFYGSEPMWVEVFSNQEMSALVDLNNITDRVDPVDDKKYKVTIYKTVLADGIIENSIGLKKINNAMYYKIFSSTLLDNEKQLQVWRFFADRGWNKVDENDLNPINKAALGIANIIFGGTP